MASTSKLFLFGLNLAIFAVASIPSISGCSSSSSSGTTTSGTGGSSSTTGGTGGGSTTSSGTGGTGGSGDPGVLVGSFVIRAKPPAGDTPGSTAVLGKVYDGPSPSAIIWVPGKKSGDCQILTPKVPFCNTPCGGSAVCVADDTCQDYPTAHGAGTVTLSGLTQESGKADIVMTPIANNYQPPASVKLAYPAFAEGDAIHFAASGDFFSPFTIDVKGVAELDLGGGTLELDPNAPFALTWNAPSKAGISTVHVKLDISHHGGTKGMIECDAADTGSISIAAELISDLIDLGVAGYPSVVVSRKATGSTTIAQGRIDAVVSSEVEREVEVPGLVSCTSDTDCPDMQTCQSDLTCK
ncbi:MAG: hypothetical protein U0359_37240 [Byssovorax sp.]